MGSLLKLSANCGYRSGQPQRADVGSTLVRNFRARLTFARNLLGFGVEGAVNPALNDNRGPVRAVALGAPQSKWRIVCRRAHVSSWSWPWFPQWPLAPKKKKQCRLRLSRKSLTPASSKNSARACLPRRGRPDPSLDRIAPIAVGPFPDISAESRQSPCALAALSPIRPADCHDRRQDRC